MQRMWLTATAHGLALHPMSAAPYLFARLERGAGQGLSRHSIAELKTLRTRYLTLFPIPPGSTEVLLFRLHHADPPASRSRRLPVDEILDLR